MNIAVHVRISGRVQGVCYLDWTVQQATVLGLTGWVRNCRNGTVEAVFIGNQEGVNDMCERCHEGPPNAAVTDVQVGKTGVPDVEGFKVRSSI